jgi:hypothetical protein
VRGFLTIPQSSSFFRRSRHQSSAKPEQPYGIAKIANNRDYNGRPNRVNANRSHPISASHSPKGVFVAVPKNVIQS